MSFSIIPTEVVEEDKKTKAKTIKKVDKIVMQVETKEGNVSMWFTPLVKKGSNGFSNTNLYNFLEKANLLTDIAQYDGQINTVDALKKYMENALTGKTVKFLPKTVTSKSGEKYSKVEKVLSVA